jgi:hypothetical protein
MKAYVLLGIVLLVFLIAQATASAVSFCINDECSVGNVTVALWHFNDGSGTQANDETTNKNNMSFKGAGEPAWNATSKFGSYALYFDGNDDYLVNYTLGDDGIENGTLEMWIMPGFTIDSSNTEEMHIFFKGAGSSEYFDLWWGVGADNTYGKLQFILRSSTLGNVFVNSTTASWNAGQWYHIAIMWGSGGAKLYVNGTLEGSNPTTRGLAAGTHYDWFIGGYSYSAKSFSGSIDEVRLLNGTYPPYYILNVSAFNAVNGSGLTDYEINVTNSTVSNYTTGLSNPAYFTNETGEFPIGDVNITVSKTGFSNETYSVNLNLITTYNLTANLTPFNYFRANDTDGGAAINSFTVIITNTTSSKSMSTANGTAAILHTDIPWGSVTVTMIASGYNTTNFTRTIDANHVLNETFTLKRAGFQLEVLDEKTGQYITFNVTIANSTLSEKITNQTDFVRNYTNITMGETTITVEEYDEISIDYQPRHYYQTFTPNTGIKMFGFLLKTSDGMLVRINVKDFNGNPIENMLITAQKQFNGSYMTIEQDKSDSAGIARFFLNTESIYQLVFEYGGQTTTVTIQPAITDYSFTLAAGINVTFSTLFTGMSYGFAPTSTLPLENVYLNYSIFSEAANIEYYGMNVSLNNQTQLYLSNITALSSGGTIYGLLNLTNATESDYVSVYAWFQKTNYSVYWFNLTYRLINESYGNATLWAAMQSMFNNPLGFDKTAGQLFVLFICLVVIGSLGFGLSSWWGGGVVSLGIIGLFTFAVNLFDPTHYILMVFVVFGLYALRSGWG